MEETPSKPSLIFPLPVEESDPDLLISYVQQLLMSASEGMKELDWFSFDAKAPKWLQPKGFESILNPIPELRWFGCHMFYEEDLDCFYEGHQPNSPKWWLNDEIINF